jgi:hypothetical protein
VNSRGQVERALPLQPDIIVSDQPAEVREMASDLAARD